MSDSSGMPGMRHQVPGGFISGQHWLCSLPLSLPTFSGEGERRKKHSVCLCCWETKANFRTLEHQHPGMLVKLLSSMNVRRLPCASLQSPTDLGPCVFETACIGSQMGASRDVGALQPNPSMGNNMFCI